jgi:tRNA U55 pseudouridine synthase TruB
MANLMKREPKNYGVTASIKGDPTASDSTGEKMSSKMNIPAAKTNMTGADKKFDGGRSNGVCYSHDRKSSQ